MTIRSRSLARVAALATVTGLLALVPTGAAQAATATCKTSFGDQPSDSTMTSDAPDVMYVGDPAKVINLSSNSVIAASSLETAYSLLGARYVSGESTPTILANGVGSSTRVTFGDAPNQYAITKGQALNVQAKGPWTFTPPATPAVVTLSTGTTYKAVTQFWDSNKNKGTAVNADCTVSSGQSTNFDTITVKARSATTVSVAPASVVEGTSAVATATVTVTGGAVAGTVKFTYNGTTSAPVAVSAGKATLTIPGTLAPGSYPVTAEFTPSNPTLYDASTSPAPATLVVSAKATATQTQLSLAPNPATTTQSVTASAQVSPASAVGAVDFLVDGAKVASGTVVNGVATGTLPAMPQGDYAVTASFVPTNSAQYLPSTSAMELLTVSAPATATTTALALSRTTAAAGDAVRGTATLAPAGAAGEVRFFAGATEIGAAPVVSGRAVVNTLAISGLAPGDHQVVARFTPSNPAAYAASASDPVTLTITPPASPTTTTLTLSPTSANALQRVTASAAVTPGNLAGTVTFTVDGRTVTGTVTDGVATAELPQLVAGSYQVSARFQPTDTTYGPSTSAGVPLTISLVDTSTSLALSATSGTSGDALEATATVTPPGVSGSVRFLVDGSVVSTEPVDGGTATTTLPAMAVGEHQVVAEFVPAGTGVARSSQSDPVTVTMRAPTTATATSTSLVLDSATVSQGTPVTARATVAADGTSPIGKVVFTVDGASVEARVSAGSAQAVLPALAVGEHDVVARFVPDDAAVFATSTSAAVRLSVLREAATTYTYVQLSPSSVLVGQPVTVTASVSSSAGAPQGTMTFTAGAQTFSTSVVDRIATWTFTPASAGTVTVEAAFAPTRPLEQKASTASATLSVAGSRAAATATGLTLATNRAVVGTVVRATAVVSADGGAALGAVQFSVDGTDVGSAVPVVAGVARLDLPSDLEPGDHDVQARFAPTDPTSQAPSSSTLRTLTVTAAAAAAETQTALGLSPSTAVAGDSVVVSASVTGVASPQGQVRFVVAPLGISKTATVDGGRAAATFASLAVGVYSVTAQFQPADPSTQAGSASAARALVVSAQEAVRTLTAVTLAPDSVDPGQAATARASVRGESGTPEGSVEFSVAGTTVSGPLDASGNVEVQLPASLASGTHTVSATYVPKAGSTHAASTGSALLVVRAAASVTTTTLTLASESVYLGDATSAVVRVTAGSGVPGGVVEVLVDGRTITAPLSAGGATVSLPALGVGTHPVVASYLPSSNHLASSSEASTLTVKPLRLAPTVTTTRLQVPATGVNLGRAIAVSATVTGGNTAGAVRFTAGWSSVVVPVVNGVASAQLPTLVAGDTVVSATFVPTDEQVLTPSFATATVRVLRARAKVTVRAKYLSRTRSLQVRALVSTVDGVGQCNGRAWITVKVGSRIVQTVKPPVECGGRITRTLDKLPKARKYTVVVKYIGSPTVLPASASVVVRP